MNSYYAAQGQGQLLGLIFAGIFAVNPFEKIDETNIEQYKTPKELCLMTPAKFLPSAICLYIVIILLVLCYYYFTGNGKKCDQKCVDGQNKVFLDTTKYYFIGFAGLVVLRYLYIFGKIIQHTL